MGMMMVVAILVVRVGVRIVVVTRGILECGEEIIEMPLGREMNWDEGDVRREEQQRQQTHPTARLAR